jgi:hypothetical protein
MQHPYLKEKLLRIHSLAAPWNPVIRFPTCFSKSGKSLVGSQVKFRRSITREGFQAGPSEQKIEFPRNLSKKYFRLGFNSQFLKLTNSTTLTSSVSLPGQRSRTYSLYPTRDPAKLLGECW